MPSSARWTISQRLKSAGASFNLKVLKQDFARGVELLADNELHPALPQDAFKIVQEQTAELADGEMQTPSTGLTERWFMRCYRRAIRCNAKQPARQ